MEAKRLSVAIASAQAGKPEGFVALMQDYGPRLYGYFFRATGSHHEADDLLGEMMLRLVQRLGGYDDRGRFEPWLFRIAANMVRDRIRRARTTPAGADWSVDDGEGRSQVDQVRGKNQPVESGLIAAEASEELTAAMETLDATTRQMILLRHFGEMSFKEIADTFDCPLGTVLAKVHRGMCALRKVMSEE